MSTLTALARVQAVVAGIAQPIATVRHVHLSDTPLVFVPLTLAGEANAPLAAMIGTAEADPTLLVVPQPRSRDHRFAFAERLADILLRYLDGYCGQTEAVSVDRGRDVRYRFVDAPQIVVPNTATIGFVRLFGRSTRFRRTDGDWPVAPTVPLLGRWLTFLGDRSEYPGSALLLPVTEALTAHWATGQSALEDANLAALLGWIDPPPGRSGAEAAAEGEDPERWPPAGPSTDPGFDNDVLAPLVTAYQRATSADEPDPAPVRSIEAELAEVLRGQLAPTWQLVWRAVHLLRRLPAGSRVERRWAEDRDAFSAHAQHVEEGGAPQPTRDGAVAAAARLDRLERAQAAYAAQRAFDDPLVMAEYRLTGEAFTAEVTLSAKNRIDDSGARRVLRPRIQVVTADRVRLAPGTQLTSPSRPVQKARVVSVGGTGNAAGGSVYEIVLELTGGMGRSLTAPPGSVPEVGEILTYTTLSEGYIPGGSFPDRDDTPWTHGGPPVFEDAVAVGVAEDPS